MSKGKTLRIGGDECWREASSVKKNHKVIEQIIQDLMGLGELVVEEIFV